MRHSNSEIWTHLVFSTKEHRAVFDDQMIPVIRKLIAEFISEIPDHQGSFEILADHIHLLIKLPGNMSVNELAEKVQSLISTRLKLEGFRKEVEWEENFHAHSVSVSKLSTEKNLIERQLIKHKDMSLEEELRFLGM